MRKSKPKYVYFFGKGKAEGSGLSFAKKVDVFWLEIPPVPSIIIDPL